MGMETLSLETESALFIAESCMRPEEERELPSTNQ